MEGFSVSRLGKNVGANMIGGGWNGLLIVVATPLYVSLLTYEGYGLVGFWLLMQVVMSLFDMGFGAALVRDFADSRGNGGFERQRTLLRTLEHVFWPVAAALTVGLALSSDWIATEWLELHVFSTADVGSALRWMALALGLQYPCALYTNGLAGLQLHGRMNLLQMGGNSLRHVGGVAVLLWSPDPVWFFRVQALVAGCQTLATQLVLWRIIRVGARRPAAFELQALVRVWRFSAGMAVTMVAGILLANADRLFISRFLPAEDLGKYTLAFAATGLLQMGIQPFYRAFFPRFAELVASGDGPQARREYYFGCQVMAGIIVPSALVGWIFAPDLFNAWIGAADETTVQSFRWLLVGISGAGLMWLPAAFQQAHGWTRLHAMMIGGALAVGAPLLLWATRLWGTPGASVIWVVHGVSDVTLGLWLMHRRLLRGELTLWYRRVLIRPILSSAAVVGVSYWLFPTDLGRASTVGWLATTGLLAVLGSLAHIPSQARHQDSAAS